MALARAIKSFTYVRLPTKDKADNHKGGVGYEDTIITGELFYTNNERKFIPILFSGTWNTATPNWSRGKLGVDLSNSSNYSNNYDQLCRHLKGIIRKEYDDGVYTRNFVNGKRCGLGTMEYSSGNKYVGGWKEDKRNVYGTLEYTNGDKYAGEWKDDKRDGQGTLEYANGDKYIGEWKDNNRNGQGTYYFADGSYYKGCWSEGKGVAGNFYNKNGEILERTETTTKVTVLKAPNIDDKFSLYKKWIGYPQYKYRREYPPER